MSPLDSSIILSRASPELQDNDEVVRIAVQNSKGKAFQYASSRLKESVEFIKTLDCKALHALYDSKSVYDPLTLTAERNSGIYTLSKYWQPKSPHLSFLFPITTSSLSS